MIVGKRPGMALVAVLAVIGLLAILAMATLSVTTRLGQGSALSQRNTRLDAAASYALATVVIEWRQRNLSSLGVGATTPIEIPVPGNPARVSATVTRIGSELFWIVAEAVAVDDARHRENLVVRLPIPRTDSQPAMVTGGDVLLSAQFSVVRDTTAGCQPRAADLAVAPGSSVSSVDGSLPMLTVERRASGLDSASLLRVVGLSIAEMAATADVVVADGGAVASPSGVVHALGDLTVSGVGGGILIVDGRLTLTGPGAYRGLIIANHGIMTGGDGMQITGSVQAGPSGVGGGSIAITHRFTLTPSACAVQSVVKSQVRPRPVAGRPWAETY